MARPRRIALTTFVAAVAAAAVLLPAQAAPQRASFFGHWKPVHIHLNAYAHWGKCYRVVGSTTQMPEWTDPQVVCKGLAELGQFDGLHFLTHSQAASFDWKHDAFTAAGDGIHGRWSLTGAKGDNFHTFRVSDAIINGHHYETAYGAAAGTPGGPLLVNLSSHKYFSGGVITQGFSLNLVGFLRARP
jgi:hypothetical protein